MSVSEVEIATGSKLQALGARNDMGTHYLRKTWSDLWFDFGDSGLTSILATRIVGLEKADLTQRHNLCTGQVTSLVRLVLADPVIGAKITVDGSPVAARDGQQAFAFDLVPGSHEIQVTKGGRTLVKRVDVTLGGPGEIRLYVDNAQLTISLVSQRRRSGAA